MVKKHTSVDSEKQYSFSINSNAQSLKPSATLAINEKSKHLISEGKKVYRLGFGQSPFLSPFGITGPRRI